MATVTTSEQSTTSWTAPSLRVGVAWMLGGRIIYNICQFGVLAVLARLGTTADVGQFVLGLSVTAPIFLFCNLQLRLALATDAGNEYAFSDYLLLRNITCVLALLLAGVVAVCLAGFQTVAFVVIAVGVSKFVESFSDIYYGRLQKCEAIPVVARSLLIRGPASLLAVWLTYWATQSLAAACLAMAGVWLVVLWTHDIPSSRTIPDPVSRARATPLPQALHRRLLALAWKAFPLGLAAGLCSLEVNVPRYVVGACFGESQLGVFGAILYLMVVGQTVVATLTYSTVARLAHLHWSGRAQAFRRVFLKVLALSVLLGLGLATVMGIGGRQILDLLYGPVYAEQYALLVLVSLATAVQFGNGILITAVQSMRRFKSLLAVRMLGLAATTCLSAAFASRYGLRGVGWGLILAATIQAIASFWLVWRWLRDAEESAGSTAEPDLADMSQPIAV